MSLYLEVRIPSVSYQKAVNSLYTGDTVQRWFTVALINAATLEWKHMAGGDRRNVQKQHVEPEYLHISLYELIFWMNLDQTRGKCGKTN